MTRRELLLLVGGAVTASPVQWFEWLEAQKKKG
jgi:hypothetical protein